MNIGIPRERRPNEYRVGLPPVGVELFTQQGHTVYIESEAGIGAGFTNEEYEAAGARIVYSVAEVYGRSETILKFSAPLPEEIEYFQNQQTLLGYLHLAIARQEVYQALLDRKLTAIAYEQIECPDGTRPVLAPVSQIGGQIAVQVAARLMQNDHGGRGVLLSGIVGIPAAEIVILGSGVAGSTAARTFAALGAHVTVLDININQLCKLVESSPFPLNTMLATPANIRLACSYADVLLGAVAIPGEPAPLVVARTLVKTMKPQSVIIDMSIDQGGCVETSRPTSHDNPTYVEEGIIHYCVPNMSGVFGRTASYALFNGAFPHLETIARYGISAAIDEDPALAKGLNIFNGEEKHIQRLTG